VITAALVSVIIDTAALEKLQGYGITAAIEGRKVQLRKTVVDAIVRSNPNIKNPDKLPVGMRIRFPEIPGG